MISKVKQFLIGLKKKFRNKKDIRIKELTTKNTDLQKSNLELLKSLENLKKDLLKANKQLTNYESRDPYDDYITVLLKKEAIKNSLININRIDEVEDNFMETMVVVDQFDCRFLTEFLINRKSLTIATALIHLNPEESAKILEYLSPELQVNVVMLMINNNKFSTEVINELEKLVNVKLPIYFILRKYQKEDPIKYVCKMLNFSNRWVETHILECIETNDIELAETIRRGMYLFEDLLFLDNRSIQRLLRDVENAELAIALKGASLGVQDKITSNLSKRLTAMIKEDMEFMGPVKESDIVEAQQHIMNHLRRLEDAGEILISHEEFIVYDY